MLWINKATFQMKCKCHFFLGKKAMLKCDDFFLSFSISNGFHVIVTYSCNIRFKDLSHLSW